MATRPRRRSDDEYARLVARHDAGETWDSLARELGITGPALSGLVRRWRRRKEMPEYPRQKYALRCPGSFERQRTAEARRDDAPGSETATAGDDAGEGTSVVRTFTVDELSRLTSLDDLLAFFNVDTDAWEVRDYRVNSWEQHSVKKGIVTLYQVRANLIPRIERKLDEARQVVQDMIADAAAHAPTYEPYPLSKAFPTGTDPALFAVAIQDPHVGMLAWGKETAGPPWDSDIAVREYARAAEHLLSLSMLYPAERILYLVGNDLLHVDAFGAGMRGGTTTRGTEQDVDSRLAKMFTLTRRCLVECIDKARLIAPVDVVVIPGNHDREQMYRMGEVLSAWYRNDERTNVIYSPTLRKFYGYGRNAFMLTHGEEYKRKRDSLPLIFATEAPAELWSGSTYREILTGHFHGTMAGQYVPTAELSESRAIRTRALPALTPADAWHTAEGYLHHRAATALVYRKSGGLLGLHEYRPEVLTP